MYEHPIKRAGLTMNRILFSNTRMVMSGFPASKPQQFTLSFKYKKYENGKEQSRAGKLLPTTPHCSSTYDARSTCTLS